MNDTMSSRSNRVRVLYSFPHKLGADRICHTAWQQVSGLAAAGAEVLAFPGVLHKPVPANVMVRPTLARGKFRIPYKLLGKMRACSLHDYVVSRRLEKLAGEIDIIHVWPIGALLTLKTAARLGIPTVLERPNAHTRFAYGVVQKECDRLGITLPQNHEHAHHADVLSKEEQEYRLACRILCPSDFVLTTFLDKGFSKKQLLRSQYGFDEKAYHPNGRLSDPSGGFTMLFVGGCAPRKGLHYALEAWCQSSASKNGTFIIAGGFVPGYAEVLSRQLAHPSVKVLGHRNDIAQLMRSSDVLVLPTVEEGSALVTYEARACGCVLLVSEAAGAVCKHLENALVHIPGDVATLAGHLNLLNEDRQLLSTLRESSLKTVHEITWLAAGRKLLAAYREALASYHRYL
jgi:glycosyltransferase involved in cell wall biosynthesis